MYLYIYIFMYIYVYIYNVCTFFSFQVLRDWLILGINPNLTDCIFLFVVRAMRSVNPTSSYRF